MSNNSFDIRLILGKNIRKYRELRGLTQEAFIEKIGIGPSAISNIECGKSYPTPETLNKIIEVLEVKPYMLLNTDDTENTSQDFNDFMLRLKLIQNNQEKFNILYGVLKVLT